MTRVRSISWTGWASMIGGGLWVLSSVHVIQPGPALSTIRGVAWLAEGLLVPLALVLLLIGALGLYRRWAKQMQTTGRAGVVVTTVGAVLALMAKLVPPLLRFDSPILRTNLPFGLGLLLLSTGLILLGSAALQGVERRGWQALPLMIGLMGLFLPVGAGVQGAAGFVAWIVFGLGWAWLGAILCVEHHRLAAPITIRS